MIKKSLLYLFIIGLLASCSIMKNRQTHKKVKLYALTGDYQKALSLIDKDSYFKEKESILLTLLEKGSLFYLKGDYKNSLISFDSAKELSDKLFTQSLKRKLIASLSNNNYDNFYGEKYERSLIRFYQSLNHLNLSKLAKTSKDRTFHLSAARANILDWDTLLENYKSRFAGDSDYKVDLMAKIYGAMIHEMIGSRSDKQIARTLYLNAKDVLFKNYNLYPSFNSSSSKFVKDYEKLPKMSKSKVQKKYITQTQTSKQLLKFINQRLKDLKKGNKENIRFIIQKDFIAQKKSKKIKIPLPHSHFVNLNQKNYNILTFTLEMLSISHGTHPSISYEVPGIELRPIDHDLSLIVKDAQGKVVKDIKLALVNPLSEISYQNLENKLTGIYTKLGARIALKHMSAILTAYQIYKSSPSAGTKFAASLTYAAANKVIEESERVDLRFWSLLPSSQYMGSSKLKKGEYKVYLKGESAKVSERFIKNIHVDGNKLESFDFNL